MNQLLEEMLSSLRNNENVTDHESTWSEGVTVEDLAKSLINIVTIAQTTLETEMEEGDMSVEDQLCEIIDIKGMFEDVAYKPGTPLQAPAEDAIYAVLEEIEEQELSESEHASR